MYLGTNIFASCNENKYQFLTIFSTKHFYKFSDVDSFLHLQKYKTGKKVG